MDRHPKTKNCKQCKGEFSCPNLSLASKYLLRQKAWEKRDFCSHKCAAIARGPLIAIKLRGKCSEKKLVHLRIMAKERIGIKRPPISDEWRRNLSLSHLGKPAANKGKKMPQISGKNHWAWKGGVTPWRKHIQGTLDWKVWRQTIFERDGFRCIDCGEGGYIEPHHIIPVRSDKSKLFDTKNGITLCRPCHMATFGKELQLANSYFALVGAIV